MSSASSSSAAALSHLNDTHRSQVLQYLKFFQAKRDENAKEIEAVFEEQKDMRLLEEMYPVDEVAQILDGVKSLVKSSMKDEFEKFTQQSVLYLRQLFLQAEGNGVAINVDLSTLDDAVLLSGIEKLDIESRGKKGLGDLPDTRRAGSLAPVAGAVDVKLVTQIKDLQDANRSLLAKFEKLSNQCRESQKECVELKGANSDLQDELRQTKGDLSNLKSSNKSAQQAEIESLRKELAQQKEEQAKQVADLKAELKAQGDTLNSKVNNAPQYQQLKKLMNTKNDQLKESRARVKQLEEHLGKSGN
jgi:myosin heavy subunit